MSKWDWIHAGLEIATFAKAQQTKSELSSMKDGVQLEQARRAFIELMRDYVFEISKDIKLAEEKIDEYPQQVYIVATTLSRRLSSSGFSTDMFPDFHDKEYVLETEKKIADVIKAVKDKLTPKKIEESEKAVKFIAELPLLRKAKEAKSALETLTDSNDEWDELQKAKSKQTTFTVIGGIGAVITACGGSQMAIFGLGMMIEGSAGGIFGGLLLLGISGAMLAGTIAAFAKSGKANPRYKELESIRNVFKKQLTTKEQWDQITSLFGNCTSQEYQVLFEERTGFLAPIIGEENKNILTDISTTE